MALQRVLYILAHVHFLTGSLQKIYGFIENVNTRLFLSFC